LLLNEVISLVKVHGPPERKLVLTAQTDIEEGEEITTKYLPALIGSARRRFKVIESFNYVIKMLLVL